MRTETSAIVVSRSAARWIVVVLVVLVVVLAGAVAVRQNLVRLPVFAAGVEGQIDRNAYQAVFLTGGQVFFGKTQSVTEELLTLTDVFYLSAGSDQQASQLIKRGNELHGPAEPMIIPMRSVLFIENLRPSSDIVTAIGKFHAGQLPVATPPAITGAPTATATARPSVSPSPSR